MIPDVKLINYKINISQSHVLYVYWKQIKGDNSTFFFKQRNLNRFLLHTVSNSAESCIVDLESTYSNINIFF